MKVYNQNGEEIALNDSDKCPETGRYLIPRGFLTTPPPPQKEGKIRVWDGVAWSYDLISPEGKTRAERDALLSATDWTQLPDVPKATRDKWKPYRKDLRDITETNAWPFAEWPEKPI
jgi:hypothetical protein